MAELGNPYVDLDEDVRYMAEAIKQANAALELDEIPIGAIIVYQGKIVARAHNQRHLLKDPTAHAEIIALTQAAAYLGDWRLTGCTMYVTLEPCPMCAGALVNARQASSGSSAFHWLSPCSAHRHVSRDSVFSMPTNKPR